MRSATQEKLLALLLKALRPLVHILIEAGIGHREFSDVAKRAYVDVASSNYGIRGRDTNISRVAVMTGLTRKEVKRVRDSLLTESNADSPRPIPASTILYHWYSDERFCDKDGQPAVLPFDNAEISFTSLVKEYAGDIPAGAIRTELVRVGSAEILDSGSIRALRRYYLPPEGNERLLRAIERPLSLMVENIRQNNVIPSRSKDHLTWPEMIVQVADIDLSKRLEIRDFAYSEILRVAEELDDDLTKYQVKPSLRPGEDRSFSVGIGFYYFEV